MKDQYPLPLPHREAMAADDFILAASNRDAAQMVHSWPNWPGHCLLLLGPSGSGKTHLLKVWLQNSEGQSVAAEKLPAKDAGGLVTRNAAIAVDDIDAIAGQREAEKALFHLYNYAREQKGFLLLTTTKPVAQWPSGLADLRSRLLASPVAVIGTPDDDLMAMLLVKQFHDRQIEVSAEVIAYLVPRVERTSAALRELVYKLDHASLAQGRRVTVALVKWVLEMRG